MNAYGEISTWEPSSVFQHSWSNFSPWAVTMKGYQGHQSSCPCSQCWLPRAFLLLNFISLIYLSLFQMATLPFSPHHSKVHLHGFQILFIWALYVISSECFPGLCYIEFIWNFTSLTLRRKKKPPAKWGALAVGCPGSGVPWQQAEWQHWILRGKMLFIRVWATLSQLELSDPGDL